MTTPRSIASGTISFGLVHIPVRFYAATSPEPRVEFNTLHKKCHGRVKQQFWCPKDEEVVTRDETEKGYEVAKDQFVVFSEEDLKALEEPETKSIEIAEFVPAAKVAPIYVEKTYYLGPDKGGERAYRLIREAMNKCGRSAIARYAVRGKQHLVLLVANRRGLVLHQLYYASEIRPFEEIPIGEAELRQSELKVAIELLDELATDAFHPEKYHDDAKARIEEVIAKKVAGQEIAIPKADGPKAEIIDLMTALKKSLPAANKSAKRAPAKEVKEPKKRGRRGR